MTSSWTRTARTCARSSKRAQEALGETAISSNEALRYGIQPSEAITGDGAAMFRHACGLGLEGIVSKRIGSRYVSGRTRVWLKSKNPKV
jgi:ATP-dependent DNA ligase